MSRIFSSCEDVTIAGKGAKFKPLLAVYDLGLNNDVDMRSQLGVTVLYDKQRVPRTSSNPDPYGSDYIYRIEIKLNAENSVLLSPVRGKSLCRVFDSIYIVLFSLFTEVIQI